MSEAVSVEAVMAEIRARVRARLREDLLRQGGSPLLQDPALFAEVEELFERAVATTTEDTLLLPALLGDAAAWRLRTSLRYQSHRGRAASSLLLFVKRRLLMPPLRWLFEYSRDNFERQRRVNQALFACVQELAIETARLRQEVRRLSP